MPQGVCAPAPRQRVCGWEGSSLEEWKDSFLVTWGPHLVCVAVRSDCPPERALPLDSGPTSSVLSFARRWPGLDVPVAGSPRAGVPPGRLCWARGESTVFVLSGVTSERVLPVKPNVALEWLTARARTPGRTDVCRGALGAGRGGGAGPGGTPPPRAPGMRCLLKAHHLSARAQPASKASAPSPLYSFQPRFLANGLRTYRPAQRSGLPTPAPRKRYLYLNKIKATLPSTRQASRSR